MIDILILKDAINGGDYVVVQQNRSGDGIGHAVVLIGYDPVRGFKVKSSDENKGKVEWIPENQMTWYQYIVTEDQYEAVTYGPSCVLNRNQVVNTLKMAHQMVTGNMLNTDFAKRNFLLLQDVGFVLKFEKKLI